MNNLDTLVNHLKGGGFLLVADKAGTWLLGSARHPNAFEKAVKEANVPYQGAFVLIGKLDNLYDYVLRFSDLAWDIAGESEKALLVWYEHGKGVPSELLDEKGRVPVMLNRCKSLQPLLEKLGHGLLCLLLPSSKEGWQALPNVLPLPLDNNCRLAPERIMQLGEGGDVKFLKY